MEEAKFRCMRCNAVGHVCNTCKNMLTRVREREERDAKTVDIAVPKATEAVEPKKTARELIQEHREKSSQVGEPKKTARELIREHRRGK